jgi:hypothetical protein
MTKGEFIDLVYTRVSGGVKSTDLSVWRQDIQKYMPFAINFALTKQYYVNLKEDGSRDMPGTFLTIIDPVDVLFDTTRKVPYLLLPFHPLALPRNRGIRFIGYRSGEAFVGGMENATALFKHYRKHNTNTVRIEVEGLKVFLHNLPTLVKKAMVKMIANLEELDDTTIIPLPSGLETEAINICIDFFTGQRTAPKDILSDSRDAALTTQQ